MRKPCYYISFFSFSLLLFASRSEAQQLKLGNNPTFIQPSAVLQLDSKNQGLLLTRVPDTTATTGIDAFSPPDGMIIYFTDSSSVSPYGPNAGVYERKNGKWQRMLFAGDGSIGIVSLNGSIVPAQTFATGTSGTGFNISTNAGTGVHTFNIPMASTADTGLVTIGAQTFGGAKTFTNTLTLGQDLFTSGSSGNSGQVLRSLGSGISPKWENMLLDSLYNVRITSPQNGDILVYNGAGTNWANTSGNGTFWMLTGNSGTDSTKNFLGTTDNRPLIFKANGAQVGYLGFGSGGGNNNVLFGNGSTVASGSTYAIAIGNATAGATYATAIGDGAQATGNPSVSLGYFNTASGKNSVAIGNNSTASGSSSVVIGSSANATGTSNGIALGTSANSANAGAIAMGNIANASGSTSIAIGYGSISKGSSGVAIGYNANAIGSYGVALGQGATDSGNQSIAIGYLARANALNSSAIGENTYAWNPNTLILGDTINNIKVGIGTNNPAYNLEVNGTGKFDNTLYLGKDLSTNGSSGNIGQALISQGGGVSPQWQNITNGTVTSVALSMPSTFTVTGSPVTSSGTLTASYANQNQNLVFASPSGSSGTPSFRALVLADLPAISLNNLSNVTITIPNPGDVLTWSGAAWINSSSSGNYWSLGGNNNATPSSFLGTTTIQPLIFKVNNQQAGYLGSTSTAFGIGATTTAQNTTSIGYGTNAGAQYSSAIGNGAQATGQSATSLGNGAIASAKNATAIGSGAQATQQNTLILGNGSVNVGIGTSNPSSTLYVAGNITATGTITPSDIRYKKNLHELQHVLSAIDSLHGYTYFFRAKEFKDKKFPTTKQIGMIAQEVEKYFPELVLTDKEGYKSLNYTQFTAVLLEAVKEQQSEIDSLKKQNEQYQKATTDQLNALMQKVEELEKMMKGK